MIPSPTGSPRFLTDPIGTVFDVVAVYEPTLTMAQTTAAVERVAKNRAARRRLARALSEKPSLLTCGLAEGPPMVDALIHVLRELGAKQLIQPRCGSCGKPQRRMTKYNDGVRICITCDNRAAGRFAAQPCANCGRVLTPRCRDKDGGPRCEWCPPEPDVDHVEVICDYIAAVSPSADRSVMRAVIVQSVRQAARRRQVAWDLQENPLLLTGQATQGSQTVMRLVRALGEHGIEGIDAPRCPFCDHARRLETRRDGRPCCHSCYQATRRTACTKCHKQQPIMARTVDGEPLCWTCTPCAEFNHEVCASCGRRAPIATHREGKPTCYHCRTMPSALCAICDKHKPCFFPDSPSPRCVNCSQRAKAQRCSRCGSLQPVSTRDTDGKPLCSQCSRRREPCCRCHRVLPVTARVEAGPVCRNCVKTEPALFRNCVDCGTFGRMRQHERCDACAAKRILTSFLADTNGNLRPCLQPVQDALTASAGHSLFNWLKRPSAALLLTQLATSRGPISHTTIDDLTPPDGARWLRHVLVAQGVLPARDERLHALERWLDAKLPEVFDPDERRLLRSYVTWSHLRRLRAASTPTSPSQNASIRNEISDVVKMLDWLRARGVTATACTQADIDQWCLQGGRMPRRARQFVAWCAQRGHMPKVSIPAPQVRQDRHLLDDDRRWYLAKVLLHDDTIAVVDRAGGLLVLLYGQTVSRIVQLTVDDVIVTQHQVQLRLGHEPVTIPTPLAALLRQLVDTRRGKAAVGHSDAHRWLFPGGDPGQPLHPQVLANRLKRVDVAVRDSRNTALMQLASTLPAKVLSELLGLSVNAATRWNAFSGLNNAEYAAELVRRQVKECAGSESVGRAPRPTARSNSGSVGNP